VGVPVHGPLRLIQGTASNDEPGLTQALIDADGHAEGYDAKADSKASGSSRATVDTGDFREQASVSGTVEGSSQVKNGPSSTSDYYSEIVSGPYYPGPKILQSANDDYAGVWIDADAYSTGDEPSMSSKTSASANGQADYLAAGDDTYRSSSAKGSIALKGTLAGEGYSEAYGVIADIQNDDGFDYLYDYPAGIDESGNLYDRSLYVYFPGVDLSYVYGFISSGGNGEKFKGSASSSVTGEARGATRISGFSVDSSDVNKGTVSLKGSASGNGWISADGEMTTYNTFDPMVSGPVEVTVDQGDQSLASMEISPYSAALAALDMDIYSEGDASASGTTTGYSYSGTNSRTSAVDGWIDSLSTAYAKGSLSGSAKTTGDAEAESGTALGGIAASGWELVPDTASPDVYMSQFTASQAGMLSSSAVGLLDTESGQGSASGKATGSATTLASLEQDTYDTTYEYLSERSASSASGTFASDFAATDGAGVATSMVNGGNFAGWYADYPICFIASMPVDYYYPHDYGTGIQTITSASALTGGNAKGTAQATKAVDTQSTSLIYNEYDDTGYPVESLDLSGYSYISDPAKSEVQLKGEGNALAWTRLFAGYKADVGDPSHENTVFSGFSAYASVQDDLKGKAKGEIKDVKAYTYVDDSSSMLLGDMSHPWVLTNKGSASAEVKPVRPSASWPYPFKTSNSYTNPTTGSEGYDTSISPNEPVYSGTSARTFKKVMNGFHLPT